MINPGQLTAFIALAPVLWAQPSQLARQRPVPSPCPYNAAFYSAGAGLGDEHALTVFPCVGAPFSIRLPFALGYFANDPPGDALYGTAFSGVAATPKRGLFRIELAPVRAVQVAGSEEFNFEGVAVYGSGSGRKILVSGDRRGTGSSWVHGLFELNPGDGDVRTVAVFDGPASVPFRGWRNLSVSEARGQALGTRDNRLEMIDLSSGRIQLVGDRLYAGAWSPDGKWIAATEDDGRQPMARLLDAGSLRTVRVLGPVDDSRVVWSPDSRFLLWWKRDSCGGYSFYYGTLEEIDIGSGKRSAISGSRCRVNQPTFGWISGTIHEGAN